MEDKYFSVNLEIEAPNKEYVENMLERMCRPLPVKDVTRIVDEEIKDPDEPKLECRIRYVENWGGQGEYFVFENKWTDETEWGLDSAFPCVSYENGELVCGKGDMLNYQALTKVRELMKLGIHFYFA